MECINEYCFCNEEIIRVKSMNNDFLKDGICIYEVIRIVDGVPLFIEDHFKRFKNSLLLSGTNYELNSNHLYSNLCKLISENKIENGNMKIVFNFLNKNPNEPIIYIYSINHYYPTKFEYEHGVKTILYKGERNNPNAKVINTSFRNLVDKKIKASGAYEAILVDNNGNITEGSKSNIFCVKENTILTAPLIDVLPGVTREKIIEVCKKLNIKVQQENIKVTEIKSMDGLFISGTSPKILPISSVDNMLFSSTKNMIIQKISKGYEEFMENYISEKKDCNFNDN